MKNYVEIEGSKVLPYGDMFEQHFKSRERSLGRRRREVDHARELLLEAVLQYALLLIVLDCLFIIVLDPVLNEFVPIGLVEKHSPVGAPCCICARIDRKGFPKGKTSSNILTYSCAHAVISWD